MRRARRGGGNRHLVFLQPPPSPTLYAYRAVTLQTPLAPLKPHLELVEVQAAIVVRVPLAEHVPHPVLGEETVENGVTTR